MVRDSISNFIIKLKNGGIAKQETVFFPYSKLVNAVAEVLKSEGFIAEIDKKGKKVSKSIELTLRYVDGQSAIKGVKRVSKPSKRIYYGTQALRPVRNGFGRLILSTPKGILTDKQARKEKIGGEALFEIW